MILKGPRLIGLVSSKSTEMLFDEPPAIAAIMSFHSFHHILFIYTMMGWRFGLWDSFTKFCRFSFSCILVWFNRRHYFQREPNYHTWHSTVVQTNLANCARGKRALSLQLWLLLIFLFFFLLWWLSLSLCFFCCWFLPFFFGWPVFQGPSLKGFSSKSIIWHHILIGGFKYFWFSPLLGEDSQFD